MIWKNGKTRVPASYHDTPPVPPWPALQMALHIPVEIRDPLGIPVATRDPFRIPVATRDPYTKPGPISNYWLQRMSFELELQGPAGLPRVPDPAKRNDAPLVLVDPDTLLFVEPEHHYFHDITTI